MNELTKVMDVHFKVSKQNSAARPQTGCDHRLIKPSPFNQVDAGDSGFKVQGQPAVLEQRRGYDEVLCAKFHAPEFECSWANARCAFVSLIAQLFCGGGEP